MDVRLALYADKQTGAYDVAVRAAPEGLAEPDDLPGRSADVILDGRPPRSEAVAVLTFARKTSNPLGNGPLAEPDRIISTYLYDARDEREIVAFDERISEDYTAYYASRGMYYLGVYSVDGPLKPQLAEFSVYATSDPEEAERIGSDDLAAYIVAIEDECRALQDRSRPRYVISLLPKKPES